ncbi:MAG: zinc ribbon domain-containing protein [Anaerolineaceae bacterium]|nr:zinc ribbon domain-containing protein [Anaerolineaceae bacterium]
MSQRNICPICGSENPEGSEFCQVCKANLQTLPEDIFRLDPDPAEQSQATVPENIENENTEPDLDSPIPPWMQKRFKQKDKPEKASFDSYTDALFGISDNRPQASAGWQPRQNKPKKTDQIYQPTLGNIVEPPLIIPDDNLKVLDEDLPNLEDFNYQRPARKWEDRLPDVVPASSRGTSYSLLDDFRTERPAKKWDDVPASGRTEGSQKITQLSLWWQQDAPLVETDEADDAGKSAEAEDPKLENSVSPTKVIDAKEILGITPDDDIFFSESDPGSLSAGASDEYKPESGSLLSELMDEINSSSVSLTSSERQENQNGTVFYSGNSPRDGAVSDEQPEIGDIDVPLDNTGSNAALLDRILRGAGYQVEGEPVPEEVSPEDKNQTEVSAPHKSDEEAEVSEPLRPIPGFFIPDVIDNPLIIDDSGDISGKDEDPDDPDGKMPEKDDNPDDQDIPWDLFGSWDMTLPQAQEDPVRTFSRSSLPEDEDSTAYQQRMISSILGKIIQAENYVRPQKRENNRAVSMGARLFWAFAAIFGILLILMTGIADQFNLPFVPSAEESGDFYRYAEEFSGNALVVMDYSPAYSSRMSPAAESLLDTLAGNAGNVSVAVLSPSAMPETRQILNRHSGAIEFAGWWPAGVISLRTRMASGDLPEQIWLLTAESSTVRNWAEQLALSDGRYTLHVMAPGQLEPVLKPYLASGMVASALSRDSDLSHYGDGGRMADREQAAVWFLAALVPLAWLSGFLGKIFKNEPELGRKTVIKTEEPRLTAEKETAND